jgi:succinate dehydrogenase / fumarate reductase flavoprotein subunit
MYERFSNLGIDLAEEPVEVAPTAHYSMGGADIDFHTGETGIERLYAVGETTGGVHGANRLGGNSLAETVAIAPLVGEHLAETLDDSRPALPADVRESAEREFAALDSLATADGDVSPRELGAEFGSLFWEHAGILRDGERLDEGLRTLLALRERMADLRIEGGKTGWDFEYAVDLGFMFTVGEAVLRGAALRAESRGAHYRTDRPETSSQWRRNVLVRRGADGMTVDTRPAGRPSQAVQEALDAGYELQYSHVE